MTQTRDRNPLKQITATTRNCLILFLSSILLVNVESQAATGANAYVTVSSSTYAVEDIVPVGADFYITTRNVSNSSFRVNIAVTANSPYYLVKPQSGRMNLGIGESDGYRVRDESGNEDEFSGRVYVLKLDIEPTETNVCWMATNCTLKLTNDSYPGGTPEWTSVPSGIGGNGDFVTFNPSQLAPGEYTVTARSSIVPDYKDTCIVRVVKPSITEPDEGEVHLFGEELKFVGVVVPEGLPNARYSWSVLQGTCVPATSFSMDFQTTLKSVGNLKVEFSVTVGNLTYRTNRTIKVVRPEVTKLSWKNDHDLTQGFTGGSVIDDPVWIKQHNGPLVKNEPGAYTRNCGAEAELAIEADLPLTHQTYVQVKGIGNRENFYLTEAVFRSWSWRPGELVLSSSPLYASVNFYDKLDVKWCYRVRNLSNGWGEWIEMNQTSHILYVTLSDPVSPEQKPHVGILDFACRWGVDANTEEMMASKLLLDGFRRHYIWDFDCHRLASDFVRLSASVGIPGRLHRWSSKFSPDDPGATIGSMVYQRTRAIDPVGGLYNGVIEWSWHQWAEVASRQCDPSAAVSLAGNWGTYEDYLFTHYQKVVVPSTQLQWVGNNAGQSVGCERFPDKCTYDSCTPLMWRGPDL